MGLIKNMLKSALPGLSHQVFLYKKTKAEPEIKLLKLLVKPGDTVIDVGANRGLYIHHFLGLGAEVIAFEPLPPLQGLLRQRYPGLRLETVALSDAPGRTTIRYPAGNFSWATLATSNQLAGASGPIESREIETRRLDSYGFAKAAFIKIDVEGFEAEVLAGAAETLRRCRPSLLIEIEERHRPNAVADVCRFLAGLDYAAYFFDAGKVRPIADFDLARDQDPAHVGEHGKDGRYINNFIFVPTERAEAFVADCGRHGHA